MQFTIMDRLFGNMLILLVASFCFFSYSWIHENRVFFATNAWKRYKVQEDTWKVPTTAPTISSTSSTPNNTTLAFGQHKVQERSRKFLTTAPAIASTPATPATSTTSETPVILLWNPTFPNHKWQLPNTFTCGSGCELTNDITRFNESDAVLFWMEKTTTKDRDHPYMRYRRPDQAFAWWCGESVWTVNNFHYRNLHGFENFFNWSMHYRTDSDVINALMPHNARDWFLHRVGRGSESSFTELNPVTTEKEFDKMFETLLKSKTKGAAWAVSDCDLMKGAKARMEFSKRIESEGGYKFDIFGACSNKNLPFENYKFYEALQEYKFYFAFENTIKCKDYITEKFWYNALYAGVVPIVLGPSKANMERLAPPGSFIHVEDINNDPKLLADFLRFLETNDKAYKEYFRWWTMPGFYPLFKFREGKVEGDHVSNWREDFQVMGFCHLCKKLRNGDHLHTQKVIPDFWQDFYGKEDPECYLP